MDRNYWLDLFTGTTWEEFLKSGASVGGFRERRKKTCEKIHVGELFICYLTGLSRLIGTLEVTSDLYMDKAPIWKDEVFPCRFRVKLLCRLEPKNGVPILDLKDRLTLFGKLGAGKKWSGFFRGSPALFDPRDGAVLADAISGAAEHPVVREYDERKYWRHPKTYESAKVGVVTVPEEQEEEPPQKTAGQLESHEEIQWLLLNLGSQLGLDVWVAKNDRKRTFQGRSFHDVPHLRQELPRQFDEATNRTIDLIDVLWLQGDAIVAAFEVEHTSSIYSGLLRMSDLVSMQPNIKIDLYLVAPDDRRDKVVSEINRPTFARLKPSLPRICRYIPYSQPKREIEAVGARIKYTKPEFIQEIAESCEPEV